MSEDLIVHILKTFSETHPAMITAKCFQADINPPANFSACSARELPSFFCLCVGAREHEDILAVFVNRAWKLRLSFSCVSCRLHSPYLKYGFLTFSPYDWPFSSSLCVWVTVDLHAFSVCELPSIWFLGMRVADIMSFRYARYGPHSRCLICSLDAFSPYALPFSAFLGVWVTVDLHTFSVCELPSLWFLGIRFLGYVHSRYVSYTSVAMFILGMWVAVFILGMWVAVFILGELQCSFSVCELQCSFSVCELRCSFSVCELQCSFSVCELQCSFSVCELRCSFSVCELIRSVHSRYVSCGVHSRYVSCSVHSRYVG